jgi:hypothetical protein
MRKVLAIALLSVSLTACGGTPEPSPSQDDGATLAHLFDDCHVNREAALGPTYDCG